MFSRPPLPREHGAWVMFFTAYLAGAGAGGRLTVPLALFLPAALAVFAIRRPAAMSLRGEPQHPSGRAAVAHWIAIYAAIGLAAGLLSLAVYRLWWLAAIGLGGAALLGVDLVRSRRTPRQTLWSELAGASGIPLVAVGAYYSAAGSLDRTAFALWVILALHFVSDVFYVRMKVRWVKRPPFNRRVRWATGWDNVLFQVFMLAAAVWLAGLGLIPRYAWAALAPTAIRRLYATATHRRDTDFRRQGYHETALAALFLVLLLLSLRLG